MGRRCKWTEGNRGFSYATTMKGVTGRFFAHKSGGDSLEVKIKHHMDSAHDGNFDIKCNACKEMTSMIDDKNKVPLENITLNGKPLEIYIKEETKKEVDKVREADMRKAGSGVGYVAPQSKFGNTSGARSQHYDTVKPMSEEVKMHLNYLNEIGGMETVNDFLSKPQVAQNGSIESVLQEHKEKVKFYLREQQRIQVELSRHQAVCDSLQSTLDILMGKVTVPGVPVTSNVGGRRGWKQIVTEVLSNGPMERIELIKALREKVPDVVDQTIYSTIYSLTKKGILENDSGVIGLVPVEN